MSGAPPQPKFKPGDRIRHIDGRVPQTVERVDVEWGARESRVSYLLEGESVWLYPDDIDGWELVPEPTVAYVLNIYVDGPTFHDNRETADSDSAANDPAYSTSDKGRVAVLTVHTDGTTELEDVR